MGAHERNKGTRGKRELAARLTERGYPARRGRQYSGSPDSPDVVCADVPFHFECKRAERIRLYAAMAQAIADAGDKVPVVAHRRNRGEWLAVLRLEDLITMLEGSP